MRNVFEHVRPLDKQILVKLKLAHCAKANVSVFLVEEKAED